MKIWTVCMSVDMRWKSYDIETWERGKTFFQFSVNKNLRYFCFMLYLHFVCVCYFSANFVSNQSQNKLTKERIGKSVWMLYFIKIKDIPNFSTMKIYIVFWKMYSVRLMLLLLLWMLLFYCSDCAYLFVCLYIYLSTYSLISTTYPLCVILPLPLCHNSKDKNIC